MADLPAVEVFEENWPAWDLFVYLSTQWRMGANGPTGLDYNVAHHRLDRLNLASDEFDGRMADLMVMEAAALEAIRAQQKEQ